MGNHLIEKQQLGITQNWRYFLFNVNFSSPKAPKNTNSNGDALLEERDGVNSL